MKVPLTLTCFLRPAGAQFPSKGSMIRRMSALRVRHSTGVRAGMKFLESLPKTGTCKVLKRKVCRRYWAAEEGAVS